MPLLYHIKYSYMNVPLVLTLVVLVVNVPLVFTFIGLELKVPLILDFVLTGDEEDCLKAIISAPLLLLDVWSWAVESYEPVAVAIR